MFQMSILIFGVLDCIIFDLIIVKSLFQSRIVHVGKEQNMLWVNKGWWRFLKPKGDLYHGQQDMVPFQS